jgi:2-polyprenyl-3-methyl-5-hydroxy-6-metoxy-1,4-benzoquinol methylase
MPFGSVFSNLNSIDLTTADGVHVRVKNTLITRIAFKILGLPHIGFRLRARNIVNNVKKGDKLLDAGCGTGVYSFTFSKLFKKIDAIDISEEKIKSANQINIFKNINFRKGDICNLKFKDNEFDAIICSDVLEHIKNDKKAFSELARVLKRKGVLLITVPSDSKNNKITYKKYGHERAGYSLKDIQNLCKRNKLIIAKFNGYSCALTDKLFYLNSKIITDKTLLGLLFYPLYLMSIVSDFIFRKDYSGSFFKIIKP